MKTLEVAIYVFSLAFQVAGAVLLIIKYLGETQKRIIDEYFPGSNIVERDENNNVKLEKEKIQKCARIIYDNRMAFVFIAVGYILSIFGATNEVNRCLLLILVAASTIAIILLEKGISIVVSKYYYADAIVIPYSEIESKVDTVATNSEIKKMFEDYNKEK